LEYVENLVPCTLLVQGALLTRAAHAVSDSRTVGVPIGAVKLVFVRTGGFNDNWHDFSRTED